MNDSLRPLDFELLLGAVRDIAQSAARRILEVYESDFVTELKDDRSPLTAADLASHATICEGLQRLTPELPILSEEAAALPYAQRSQWARYWLVDPLDGTKEFIKRNGEFTVNIALIEGHAPVLGVVHVPVSHTSYFAGLGLGSFRQVGENAQCELLRTRPVNPQKIVVCGSRSHGSNAVQEMIRKLPGEVEFISQGSSLKFCLVAEGRADIYPRFGLTSEWDTAAAQCVVELAGGVVTDTRFQRLSYNTKESLLNPHFLVIADQTYPWRTVVPELAD